MIHFTAADGEHTFSTLRFSPAITILPYKQELIGYPLSRKFMMSAAVAGLSMSESCPLSAKIGYACGNAMQPCHRKTFSKQILLQLSEKIMSQTTRWMTSEVF